MAERERRVTPSHEIQLRAPTSIIFNTPRVPKLFIYPGEVMARLDWGSLHRTFRMNDDDPLLIITNHVQVLFGTLDDVRGFGVRLTTDLRFTTEHNI